MRTIKFCNSVLFCSLLFVVVVHASSCDTQDSHMRHRLCSKLHRGPSQLFALQQSSIVISQLIVENRHVCLLHLHLTPPVRGFPSKYRHNVWCGVSTVVHKFQPWSMLITASVHLVYISRRSTEENRTEFTCTH